MSFALPCDDSSVYNGPCKTPDLSECSIKARSLSNVGSAFLTLYTRYVFYYRESTETVGEVLGTSAVRGDITRARCQDFWPCASGRKSRVLESPMQEHHGYAPSAYRMAGESVLSVYSTF